MKQKYFYLFVLGTLAGTVLWGAERAEAESDESSVKPAPKVPYTSPAEVDTALKAVEAETKASGQKQSAANLKAAKDTKHIDEDVKTVDDLQNSATAASPLADTVVDLQTGRGTKIHGVHEQTEFYINPTTHKRELKAVIDGLPAPVVSGLESGGKTPGDKDVLSSEHRPSSDKKDDQAKKSDSETHSRFYSQEPPFNFAQHEQTLEKNAAHFAALFQNPQSNVGHSLPAPGMSSLDIGSGFNPGVRSGDSPVGGFGSSASAAHKK